MWLCELECLWITADSKQRRISTYSSRFVYFAVASPPVSSACAYFHHNGFLLFAVLHVTKNERRYSFYPLLVREDLKQH